MEVVLAGPAALIAASELMPAVDGDLRSTTALINRAYRGVGTSSGWSTEAGAITGDRTTKRLLRADVAAKPHAWLLIWREPSKDALAGCVWLEPTGETSWYLGSLAVDPQLQQGGLGQALLSAAEQWMSLRGCKRVRMSVLNVRETLIAWYLRRGYCKTGETEPFPYGDDRFGIPQRDDLCFVILQKYITKS